MTQEQQPVVARRRTNSEPLETRPETEPLLGEDFSQLQQVLVAEDRLTQQQQPVVARSRTTFEPLEIGPETVPLCEERPTTSANLSRLLSALIERAQAFGFRSWAPNPSPPETSLLGENGYEEFVGELTLEDVKNPHEIWPTSPTPYFFLSQTGLDEVKKDISRPTYWFLTSVLNVDAFLDEEDTVNGVTNVRALMEQAYKCTHALLILSPSFRTRKFCVRLLNTLMGRDRRQPGEIKVLPTLWLMSNLDGYHSDVRDIKWFVRADTRFSVDYMTQFLWPAIVNELGLPAMTTEEMEEQVCRYVREHRGGGRYEISKDLESFERRMPKEENMGDIGPTRQFLSICGLPSRLSRLLNRSYWFLGFLFVVSLVIVSTSEDPHQFSVSHPKRPEQVDKEEYPWSTLPSAIPYTFGRDENLRKLEEYFTKPSRSAAVTGLAGVGKSHCANKFAHDWVGEGPKHNKRRFGFWIAAETEGTVRRGYNDILEAIGEEIKDLNEYISTARLAEILWSALTMPALDFEWIVVFDNVPAVSSESQKRGPEVIKDWFFPAPKYSWGMGRILFTTQSTSYQGNTPLGYIQRFELRPLSTKASMEMLLARRMGKGWAEASRKTKKAAEVLVGKDYFDGLPIAIVAAAEYMNQQGITMTEYLQRMNDVDPQSRVNEATQLVVDFARDQGHTRILDVMAFVSPDGIPLWLVGEDRETVDAVSHLTTLSIIRWDDHQHVSMHRLYQIALQKDGHIESAIAAVHHVLKVFHSMNHQTWSRPTELIPHVQSLKSHFGSSVDKNVTLAFSDSLHISALVLEMASFEYDEAKRYFEDSLELNLSVYGQDAKNSDLARTFNDLGGLLKNMGDYKGAKERFEQALEMMWAMYGQDAKNANLAKTINNLGIVLKDEGDYEGAKEWYEQALEMKWAVYGQEARNTDLAGTINNLGILLGMMGDYKGAKKLYQQALEMKWAVYGQDAKNSDLASTINNLGVLLKEMGDYKGAKERHEQALEMQWAMYGQDAKNTALAATINNLGMLLSLLGDYKGAKKRYEQALEMKWAVHGQDANNTDIAGTINNLGVLLGDMGDYQGAKERYEEALEMMWAVYGQDAKTMDLARTINNLGLLLQAMRDYKGAKKEFEQALEMKWVVYGQEAKNSDLAITINNLGLLLGDVGDYKGAKVKMEQALEMKWAVYGRDAKNEDLAGSFFSLGDLSETTGDVAGAREYYQKCLQMLEDAYGKDTSIPLLGQAKSRLEQLEQKQE